MEGSYTEAQLNDNNIANQINSTVYRLLKDLSEESRTAKLWINYLNQSQMMRLFIYAERTGDFHLHLYCVQKMIPLFHASGHLNYAKSSCR